MFDVRRKKATFFGQTERLETAATDGVVVWQQASQDGIETFLDQTQPLESFIFKACSKDVTFEARDSQYFEIGLWIRETPSATRTSGNDGSAPK
jgi:hypothetical protein